jgi:serine/threonine protein kinase
VRLFYPARTRCRHERAAGGAGAGRKRLRRFEQEVRTIAALNHPNILAIHDIGTHDGAPFVLSEFLAGMTLREKLEAGPLPVRRAIEYALGIAQGLAAGRSVAPDPLRRTKDGPYRAALLFTSNPQSRW